MRVKMHSPKRTACFKYGSWWGRLPSSTVAPYVELQQIRGQKHHEASTINSIAMPIYLLLYIKWEEHFWYVIEITQFPFLISKNKE